MERIKKAIEKARGDGKRPGSGLTFQDAEPVSGGTRSSGHKYQVASVDPVSLERNRIIANDKQDVRTASFDMLRTQVLRGMWDNELRTLAVTSPTPECGKTTVAINLALSAAQRSELTVVLGDLDLRRPKIAEYLGIKTDRGLSDYLEGRFPLEEVLVDPGISRLLLLPNSKAYRSAAEMMTTSEMKSLVKNLQSDEQDRVNIFDLPPVLTSDDTISFLPQVDTVLLVVADGQTKKPELEESLRMLEHATLLGVVLNKSADSSPRPYYY